MARVSGKKLLLGLAPVPLLVLSLLLFGGVIAFGVVGILKANEVNPCAQSNATEDCVLQVDLLTTGSGGAQDVTGQAGQTLEWVWWLLGSSGCGVVFSLASMCAVWVLIEVIRKFQIIEQEEKDSRRRGRPSIHVPLTESEAHESAASTLQGGGRVEADGGEREDSNEPNSGTEITIDVIGEYEVQEWQRNPLRKFSPGSLTTLFFSILSFTCAFLCLLWSIAIAYDHTRRSVKSVGAFLGVEFLAGLALPLFIFVSVILLAVVLDFITIGHLDARQGLTRFLPGSLQFVRGKFNNYWVIEDTFYFKLKKRSDRLEHNCFYSFDKTLATWYLATIVSLSLLLAFSYFVDITIDQARTAISCGEVDRSYDCFNTSTLTHVDCVDDIAGPLLYCFKFLRFGVDQDIIAALSQAFAFYLVTVTFFVKIFSVVKVFLHLKPSRFWGIMFVGLGVLLLIATVIVCIIWIRGYASPSIVAIIRLNVINLAQFVMVCFFLIVTGLLLLEGKWWERIPLHPAKPVELGLVHYGDHASHGELEKAEHALATRSQPDSKPAAHTEV